MSQGCFLLEQSDYILENQSGSSRGLLVMVVEIDEDTRAQVLELFEPMVHEVTMHVFIDGEKCLYCNDVRSMAEQISDISDKIKLEIHEGPLGEGKAAEFGVEHVPATVLHGEDRRRRRDRDVQRRSRRVRSSP